MELDFFDCNCMVGRSWFGHPVPARLETPEQLLGEMDYYGIRESLVYSAMAKEYVLSMGNEEALRWAERHRRLHPSWVLVLHHMLDMSDPGEAVRAMLDQGVRAVRFFAPYQFPYLVARWVCGELLSTLQEHRIPILLAGSDLSGRWGVWQERPGFSVENIHEIAQSYPNLPVVIARLGTANRVIIPLFKQCPNLYADVSAFSTHRGVEFLCQQIGAERLLYGSGLPFGNPAPAMASIRYSDIPLEDKKLVAGGNLRRLLAEVRS